MMSPEQLRERDTPHPHLTRGSLNNTARTRAAIRGAPSAMMMNSSSVESMRAMPCKETRLSTGRVEISTRAAEFDDNNDANFTPVLLRLVKSTLKPNS